MKNRIITISRQFGSSGREIGEELAKRLNISFYDKEIFDEASKNSGIDTKFFELFEKRTDYYFSAAFQSDIANSYISLGDRVFLSLARTIQEIAEREPCVIVGRGANNILAKRDDVLNVFIYADKNKRISKIADVYGITFEKAKKYTEIVDKSRIRYLKAYTNQKFGNAEDYHLCINSGAVGIESCVSAIKSLYDRQL